MGQLKLDIGISMKSFIHSYKIIHEFNKDKGFYLHGMSSCKNLDLISHTPLFLHKIMKILSRRIVNKIPLDIGV